jgi:hypothetical protein
METAAREAGLQQDDASEEQHGRDRQDDEADDQQPSHTLVRRP